MAFPPLFTRVIAILGGTNTRLFWQFTEDLGGANTSLFWHFTEARQVLWLPAEAIMACVISNAMIELLWHAHLGEFLVSGIIGEDSLSFRVFEFLSICFYCIIVFLVFSMVGFKTRSLNFIYPVHLPRLFWQTTIRHAILNIVSTRFYYIINRRKRLLWHHSITLPLILTNYGFHCSICHISLMK